MISRRLAFMVAMCVALATGCDSNNGGLVPGGPNDAIPTPTPTAPPADADAHGGKTRAHAVRAHVAVPG